MLLSGIGMGSDARYVFPLNSVVRTRNLRANSRLLFLTKFLEKRFRP
jgi:hypothetical protein